MELYAPAALSPRRKHLPTAKEGDLSVSLEAVEKRKFLTLAEIEPRFLVLFSSYPILE
jgi:hypothetical protein